MLWTSDYRPTQLQEIVGNRDQVRELAQWAKSWSKHNEAVVLHGPPGIGKTSAAHALAAEKDWEVMEMNASDKRTGGIIKRIAGESSQTASLTGAKRKLLILDEADNLHGHSDRGGKSELTRTIKSANQPIVLIANDYYGLTRGLRSATQDIEFDHLNQREIAKALRSICKKRGIDYEIDALKKLARNANGDLRAAINDLQKNAVGVDKLTVPNVTVAPRDQETEIFPFLDLLLKEGDAKSVQENARELDMTPDELFRWVEENVHREYDGEELADAISRLSKADVWLGRTRATQEYRYWRYVNNELTAGVASARSGKRGGWTRWQPPRWRKKKGPSEELLQRIASRAGCSTQTARIEIVPYLRVLVPYCKPRELTVAMAAWYDMDASDVAEITGSGKDTNKVQSIVEDAKEQQRDFDITPPDDTIAPSDSQELNQDEESTQDEEQEPLTELETPEKDEDDENTEQTEDTDSTEPEEPTEASETTEPKVSKSDEDDDDVESTDSSTTESDDDEDQASLNDFF